MSGKRGAEKQLTDRNCDRDDDDEEVSEGAEFKQAAPAEIATRKIRGLPSRKGPTPAPLAPLDTPKPPVFGIAASSGFGGFGPISSPASPTTISTPNPFATSSTPALNPSAAPFSFGASSTSSSSFSFPQSKPAAVPTPAPATPFNSFPGASSFSFPTKPPAPSVNPALTYYTGLRALNLALLDSLKKEVEKDAFVDLGGSDGLAKWKASYEQHRSKLDKDFKEASKKETLSNGASSSLSPAATPAPAPTSAAAPAPVSTPAPPPAPPAAEKPASGPPVFGNLNGGFKFGGAVAPSTPSSPPTASTPVAGGFVPDFSSVKAGSGAFSMPIPTASAPSPPPAVPAPAPSAAPKATSTAPPSLLRQLSNPTAPAAPSPLRFGESASPTSSPVKETPAEGTPKKFSFGNTFGAIAKGSPEASKPAAPPTPSFTFGASASSTSTSTTPASAGFGSSIPPINFGAPASTTAASTPFSFVPKPPTIPSPASATTGSLSAPTSSSGPFGSTPIGFGSAVSPPKFVPASPPIASTFGGTSPTFGFGAALASKPKPVAGGSGFLFGSGVGTGSTPAPAFPGFSFGSTPSAPKSAPAETAPVKTTTGFSVASSAATSEAGDSAPASGTEGGDDTAPPTPSGDPFGGRGAGEEDEDVLFEAPKAKIWAWEKKKEDSKEGEAADGWDPKGVCKVEIKKNKEGGWKRVLARNTVNASVVLNFRLSADVKFTKKDGQPQYLYFTASHDGKMKNFRLQIKTEAMRDELVDELEKNQK